MGVSEPILRQIKSWPFFDQTLMQIPRFGFPKSIQMVNFIKFDILCDFVNEELHLFPSKFDQKWSNFDGWWLVRSVWTISFILRRIFFSPLPHFSPPQGGKNTPPKTPLFDQKCQKYSLRNRLKKSIDFCTHLGIVFYWLFLGFSAPLGTTKN